MVNLNSNNIQIETETFGKRSNPALLLIAGLSGQMLFWPSDFCNAIADKGFYVIRFDNRDTGLSTKANGPGLEEIKEKIGALFLGEQTSVPYTIADLANDGLGILDALDIKKAHICGMSMGGYIAQTLCINHPSRVISLTSIYSHTGNKPEFMPTQEVLDALFVPMPEEREANIEQRLSFFRLISGKGGTFDEKFHRDILAASFDRCLCIEGTARQYLAILTQKDRVSDLGKLDIPALVIHGDEDPLVPLAGGESTADAIPNAELVIINGMGHDLPNLNTFGSKIADLLIEHMKKA